jgi:hypothetical protein
MISSFIKKVEESISSSAIVVYCDIQKYFSSTKKEVYIKGDLTFVDLSSLIFAVYVLEKGKKIVFDKYRFQYMDSKKKLVFRYDNAPHYKNISTYPVHKHLKDGMVVESSIPEFSELLEEIAAFISQAAGSP